MSSVERTRTKPAFDLGLEDVMIGPRTIVPVIETAATQPDHAQAEPTITLFARDMGFVLAAPTVLRAEGILWFDVGPAEVELSAAGEWLGFMHTTKTIPVNNAAGFGVSARALASVVRWSRTYLGNNPLKLVVNREAGAVLVKPDRTTLTGGWPLEALLIDLNGATMFDDIDREAQAKSYDRRLPHWNLTGYFHRPTELDQVRRDAVTTIDHKVLHRVLADACKLIPRNKSKPGMIQLADGRIYGGAEDLLFWYEVPTLSGHGLVVVREQLDAFVNLLGLLPSSQTCCIARDDDYHVFQNSRSRIFLRNVDARHPADLSRIVGKEDKPAVHVNAAKLRRELSALGGGDATHADVVFLHAWLHPGDPPTLQTESRNPRNGQQFTKGGDLLLYEAHDPTLRLDVLTELQSAKKALARCNGTVSLRATENSLYISSTVPGAARLTRTAKLPALPAEPPAQLARQVRRIARGMGL